MQLWYLAHTKPSHERQVAVLLHQKGFGVFLPLVWVNPVNPRAAPARPFFPGYVFLQATRERVVTSETRWLPGLKHLVEYDGRPAAVADCLIGELRQQLSRIQAVSGMSFDEAPSGSVLTEVRGAFAGYEGLFDSRRPGHERARILVAYVQQHCADHEHDISRPRTVSGNGNHA